MILLDTHVVIWLMAGSANLSAAAAKAIATSWAEGAPPAISTASVYELVCAGKRGRVSMHVSDALLLEKLRAWFRILPVTDAIAFEAGALREPFHGDPMDRLIAATAIVHQCVLVTRDDQIRKAAACKTLW